MEPPPMIDAVHSPQRRDGRRGDSNSGSDSDGTSSDSVGHGIYLDEGSGSVAAVSITAHMDTAQQALGDGGGGGGGGGGDGGGGGGASSRGVHSVANSGAARPATAASSSMGTAPQRTRQSAWQSPRLSAPSAAVPQRPSTAAGSASRRAAARPQSAHRTLFRSPPLGSVEYAEAQWLRERIVRAKQMLNKLTWCAI
jgi:hypothetical protein